MLARTKLRTHDMVRGFAPIRIAIDRVIDAPGAARALHQKHVAPRVRLGDGFEGIDARRMNEVKRRS